MWSTRHVCHYTVLLLASFALNTGFAQPVVLQRIDAPVTPDNSVLYDFGYKQVLRVPKILIPPTALPKDPRQPIQARTLSMVFHFPEMVLSDYPSGADTIFDSLQGKHVLQTDSFPVAVVWMFYSPRKVGLSSREVRRKEGLPEAEGRPSRM